MYSLNCNPSEPAEIGLLLLWLLWHLHLYSFFSLCSRTEAALCVILTPNAVQWDVTLSAAHTETCSLAFVLYVKGNCN